MWSNWKKNVEFPKKNEKSLSSSDSCHNEFELYGKNMIYKMIMLCKNEKQKTKNLTNVMDFF